MRDKIDLVINTGYVDRVIRELPGVEVNLDPILNVAFDSDWRGIQGKICGNIIPSMCHAYTFILMNKHELIRQNEHDQSVSYDVAKKYLHDLIDAAVDFPECVIDFSK